MLAAGSAARVEARPGGRERVRAASALAGSRVLVTDGDTRSALAIARSLVQGGYSVHVVAVERRSLAGAVRGIASTCVMPDPLLAPAAFADAIVEYAASHAVDVVLPVSDAALLAVLPRGSHAGPAIIPFAADAAFRAASDKSRLRTAAAAVGFAYPDEWPIQSPSDIDHVCWAAHQYPVVVKPARSVVTDGRGMRHKTGVRFAESAAQLATVAATFEGCDYPLLVQQRIVGDGGGLFLLMWDGRVVARFAHRRLREKPPSGGVSVYAESVAVDPDLEASAVALLRQLDWCGVAMIEYKTDRSTGVPYLMEINGRFWGSLQLAVDAGVDFPRLLVECALGRPPGPVASYRVGVRSRWWWGDVDQLLARLTRSAATLHLPPGAPSRSQAVLDFISSIGPRTRDSVFRASDPGPFFHESRRWLRRLV